MTSSLLAEGALVDLDGTIVVQLLIFFALLVLLNWLVFQPMIRLFAAREAAIDGAREEAKQMDRDAKDSGGELDEARRKVRAEASAARELVRAEALKAERVVLETARRDSLAKIATADAQLESEGKKARAEIATTTPSLAREIAAKLLGREVS